MKPVGVLDTEGLVDVFARVEGRRLVGVVDSCGVVELVFDDDSPGGNLISIFTDRAPHTGLVAFGGVASPEEYVAACRRAAA